MNFIEFLFALVARFVNVDQVKWNKLKLDGQTWVEQHKDRDDILGKVLRHQNEWYAQLVLSIFFLFSVKTISRWMVAAASEEGEDDDLGEDDEDLQEEDQYQPVRKNARKLNLA